ncbi:hypothetical protein C2869_19060 [Saccharobesus litoralis]|uniref:DUF4350 domain-containing protein n=1 Tax=Saccharobesus litoralis TaxID=2172099 RepID=A0A2S0VVX6_9ALTE|nr:DUF4350 domain-containing protein [Saccharobesus litoralis]AWB68374.1 hypothetical protein C2869_19060 [Saccharobesus litoralis]
MKSRNFALAALIFLCLSLVIALLVFIDWEKKEIELGLNRDAAQNPMLAAELLLKKYDKTITRLSESQQFLLNKQITLSTSSSLILDEAALVEHPFIKPALSKWVQAGGHLIYVVSSRREQLTLGDNPFIETAEITLHEHEFGWQRQNVLAEPEANLHLPYKESSLALYLPYSYYFSNCAGSAHTLLPTPDKTALEQQDEQKKSAPNEDTAPAAQLICEIGYDDGYVTFLPSIDIISNHGLRHLDHGAFLLWLIGDNSHLFYLPSLQSPNWLVSLWNWSWQVVVMFLLLSASCLWYLAMRLGPAKVPNQEQKVPFSRHVRATGQFMQAQGHDEQLKQALLQDIETLVERRQPNFKHLARPEQARVLSQITGNDRDTLLQLLNDPLPEEASARTKTVNLFKQLRKAI